MGKDEEGKSNTEAYRKSRTRNQDPGPGTPIGSQIRDLGTPKYSSRTRDTDMGPKSLISN